MKGQNLVQINGRYYDAVSGMPAQISDRSPVKAASTPATPPTKPSQANRPMRAFSDFGPARPFQSSLAKPDAATNNLVQPTKHVTRHNEQVHHGTVHKKLQKSQTLNRQALKQPQVAQQTSEAKTAKPTIQFAPHPKPLVSREPAPLLNHGQPVLEVPKEKPKTSHAAQAHHTEVPTRQEVRHETAALGSQTLKESLIKEGLAQAEANREAKPRAGFFKRLLGGKSKFTTVMSTSLSVLVLGAYLTYINLPNISMRVAATRAGINASLPSYSPDGYALSGAITYAPSEVSVNYKSNTSEQGFTVTQRASTWDSQAVLGKYVNKQTTAYLTLQEQGLTVYTYGNKAAWSNGGLFYTIEGDAPLSSEQIIKIATSM